MFPTIAIVGRPNVGKSTLFNALTQTRDALVAAQPGLTRDRKFGRGRVGSSDYWLVDTGGLGEEGDAILEHITQQALLAIQEANCVLFMVDGQVGLTVVDENIAQILRKFNTPIHLVINKTENMQSEGASAEFHGLGFGVIHTISAVHQRGIEALMEKVLLDVSKFFCTPLSLKNDLLLSQDKSNSSLLEREMGRNFMDTDDADNASIKIAIIGRPNVGKSTLVNRMLGYERVITFNQPGTTRDSIFIPFEHEGQLYTLIDTAGIRRRAKVSDKIEKFSVIKALQAIEVAHVVIMLLDASEGMTDQDANLLGYVLDSGRALVIAINKWDGLEHSHRNQVRYHLSRKLHFIDLTVLS